MNEEEKKKIRPLYSALQGNLSQTPTVEVKSYLFEDEAGEWEQVNATIDQLNTITGKSYDRYKLAPVGGRENLSMFLYRTRLGELISHLHAEYFSDEPAPFSGMPSTVQTYNLSQQQSQQQTMMVTLLELQSKIDQKLSKTTDEKEKSFLEKLKNQLPTVISVAQLIQIILNLAHQTGLDPHTASTLLA